MTFDFYRQNDGKPQARVWDNERVLEYLAGHGIAKAIVHFSGGHDSGGHDSITFLDDDGNQVSDNLLPDTRADWNAYRAYDQRMHEWYLIEGTPDNVMLDEALSKPVYDRYYSFAGEYYVDGEVIWDVAERRAYMKVSEEVATYEDLEYEL